MDQLDLSEFFQTKAQAQDFSNRLGTVSEKIYVTGFDLDKTLLEQFGIQKKDKFMTFLRDSNVNVGSNTELKNFISKIQTTIAAIPVISLTLSIEPNEYVIKSISDWIMLNLKKQILLDITVDIEMIGGSTINFAGKYVDFSLKPIFKEVMNEGTAKEVAPANGQIDYKKYHATALKAPITPQLTH